MNIFNNCQENQYASDYTKIKRERAQKKDIKIILKEKKKRRINTDLAFDINTNLKSKFDYDNIKNISVTKDISSVTFIDPSGNLFSTDCNYDYLNYITKPKICCKN